jgi:Flp pilus assembly protein CpaB
MRTKPPVRHLPSALPRVPLGLALRRRPRLRWALVGLVALVLGLVVRHVVDEAAATRAAWGPTEVVRVAARDLEVGHVLRAGDTRAVTVPRAAAPAGALHDAAKGRTVRSSVLEGEVLLARRLAERGAIGIAALLPGGTRAVAIPVEAGTAPPLQVGQLVDVIAVTAADEASGSAPGFVLAADAPVVEVGEQAVTVAVARELAPRIAVALAGGAVSLALVAPG